MNIFGRPNKKIDIYDKIALLFFSLWIIIFLLNSSFAGTWNEKPVMCEQKEIALQAVKDKGEIPMFTGIQSTKVRNKEGLSVVPAHIPIQLFVNIKTKTYTIMEYHPSYNSACVISFGNDWKSIGAKS
tara:strand:- start:497 stop:880 length:384 start_codon:yes stop_codon:yes gene_type:complete